MYGSILKIDCKNQFFQSQKLCSRNCGKPQHNFMKIQPLEGQLVLMRKLSSNCEKIKTKNFENDFPKSCNV